MIKVIYLGSIEKRDTLFMFPQTLSMIISDNVLNTKSKEKKEEEDRFQIHY